MEAAHPDGRSGKAKLGAMQGQVGLPAGTHAPQAGSVTSPRLAAKIQRPPDNPFRRITDHRCRRLSHPLFANGCSPPIQMNVAPETNSNRIAGVASLDFVFDRCASLRPIKCGGDNLFAREVLLYHRGNANFRNPEEWNRLCLLNGTQGRLAAKTFKEGQHRDYNNRRGNHNSRFSKGIGQPWCR